MKIHYWAVFLLALFTSMSFAPDYLFVTGAPATEDSGGETRLVFYQDGGPYLSDLEVQVSDDSGAPIMTTVTRGPLLVLNLPDGQYTVAVSRPGGTVQRARVAVEGGGLEQVPVHLAAP